MTVLGQHGSGIFPGDVDVIDTSSEAVVCDKACHAGTLGVAAGGGVSPFGLPEHAHAQDRRSRYLESLP